jgi:hypothetical protein
VELRHRYAPIVNPSCLIALFLKNQGKQFGNARIVFHNHNFHFISFPEARKINSPEMQYCSYSATSQRAVCNSKAWTGSHLVLRAFSLLFSRSLVILWRFQFQLPMLSALSIEKASAKSIGDKMAFWLMLFSDRA